MHVVKRLLLRRSCLAAAVAVLGIAFQAGSRGEEPLLRQVQTIPMENVEGRFDHFGIDETARRLYVAALGNNSLEAIDLAAGRRLRSITGLKEPTGVRVLPDSGHVVAASGGDGKLRIYDRDLKRIGEIGDLDDADNVRLGPQGKHVVVGYGAGALAEIDPQRPGKVADVKLAGHPESFQLEASGNRIFVNVPSAHEIAVVDRQKHTVIATWPMRDAQANFPMALDESQHRLFVGCRRPAVLLVLDTQTGRTIASLPCCGDTDDVYYDPTARRAYVTGGAGCITVVAQRDADHYEVAGSVPTAPGARTSFYSPQSRRLYVAVPHRGDQRAEIRVYAAR